MHHRNDDSGPIKVTREIPLWGILTVIGAIAGQGILLWAGQREQSINLGTIGEQIKAQSVEIQRLSVAVGSKDLKDVEHDIKLDDLQRRLNKIEGLGR
jgi:hypothetical protein